MAQLELDISVTVKIYSEKPCLVYAPFAFESLHIDDIDICGYDGDQMGIEIFEAGEWQELDHGKLYAMDGWTSPSDQDIELVKQVIADASISSLHPLRLRSLNNGKIYFLTGLEKEKTDLGAKVRGALDDQDYETALEFMTRLARIESQMD